MNNFEIDLMKKKEVQKKLIKSKKKAAFFSNGMMAFIVLFSVVFFVYGLLVKDTFVVHDIYAYNYGEKNRWLVWCILLGTDLVLVFLWVIFKLVIYRICGKYISERVNESLIISDANVEYGYQNLVGSTDVDRVIITLPVRDIKKVKINRQSECVEICGLVSSVYYDNYKNKETRALKDKFEEGTLILFDYFKPGIIKFFEKNYKEIVEVE